MRYLEKIAEIAKIVIPMFHQVLSILHFCVSIACFVSTHVSIRYISSTFVDYEQPATANCCVPHFVCLFVEQMVFPFRDHCW